MLFKCSKNAVLGRLKTVQCKCFFWNQPEACFWLCYGSIFFIMLSDLGKVRKMNEVFLRETVLWIESSFSASFCWLWDLLPDNLKLVDKLKIRGFYFIIYFLVQISFFGTALGRFSLCSFKIFPCRHFHVNFFDANIFTQALLIEI